MLDWMRLRLCAVSGWSALGICGADADPDQIKTFVHVHASLRLTPASVLSVIQLPAESWPVFSSFKTTALIVAVQRGSNILTTN